MIVILRVEKHVLFFNNMRSKTEKNKLSVAKAIKEMLTT